jgi:hypothetical protein
MTATIKVDRAPVLTLWAAVVAERLGHPPDTALSLEPVFRIRVRADLQPGICKRSATAIG